MKKTIPMVCLLVLVSIAGLAGAQKPQASFCGDGRCDMAERGICKEDCGGFEPNYQSFIEDFNNSPVTLILLNLFIVTDIILAYYLIKREEKSTTLIRKMYAEVPRKT